MWIPYCWVHVCEHVPLGYIVDDKGSILEGIVTDNLPILVVVDEPEGALLDVQWPLEVQPESEVQAVAASNVQTAVTVDNTTWVLTDKMTHGSLSEPSIGLVAHPVRIGSASLLGARSCKDWERDTIGGANQLEREFMFLT